PLFRALRCDKLVLAGLQSLVELYLEAPLPRRGARPAEFDDSPQLLEEVPLLRMLRTTDETLRARAVRMVNKLASLPAATRVGSGPSQLGGGTVPRSKLPSVTVEIVPEK